MVGRGLERTRGSWAGWRDSWVAGRAPRGVGLWALALVAQVLAMALGGRPSEKGARNRVLGAHGGGSSDR